MASTGVALFVYKRPEHTRRVLDGLERSGIDELHVFADGPKPDDDTDRITEVRAAIDEIDWCDIHLTERSENWGLANSTIDGVNRVFENHDRIVVLEDDDVPAPAFFDFMTTCLDYYADVPRVMNVTGYSPPIDIPPSYPYDVYFTYRECTWSWGTWKEAWERYERRPEEILDQFERDPEALENRLRKAGEDMFPILEAQLDGEVDSWSIWWGLALIRHGGLGLNPVEPLVKNIGHDGTGVHSKATSKYDVSLTPGRDVSNLELPEEPFVDETINRRFNAIKTRGKVGRVLHQFRRLARRARWLTASP